MQWGLCVGREMRVCCVLLVVVVALWCSSVGDTSSEGALYGPGFQVCVLCFSVFVCGGVCVCVFLWHRFFVELCTREECVAC